MKKISMIVIAVLVIMTFTACGAKQTDEPQKEDTVKTVQSTNGYITVNEYNKDGLKTYISDYDECITFALPDESDSKYYQNSGNYIFFQTVGKSGDFFGLSSTLNSFVAGTDYTQETLKADLEAYIAEYPNIYSNLREVTVGDYTYQLVDCTTNGEDSNYYYTVVDGKPVEISVVSKALIESDDVKATIESVKWSFE